MLRSKKTIVIALLLAGSAVGLNFDFYMSLMRGTPNSAAPDPDGAPTPKDPANSGPASPTGASVTGTPNTEPLGAGAGAPVPDGSSPPVVPADTNPVIVARPEAPSAIMNTIEKLVKTFASVRTRPARPEPRRMTAFHSDAEAVSGMTLETLLEEAEKAREKAKVAPETVLVKEAKKKEDEGPKAGSPDSSTPALPKGPTAESMIESAELTCILKAGTSSICVVGRKRLRVGDRFPGTQFKVSEISHRNVTFSDGTATIEKELAALTTGKGSQGSAPASPDEEGGS